MAEFQPRPILDTLLAHEVDFVLIGGLAGIAHGSSYPSYDVDVAYARDDLIAMKEAAGRPKDLLMATEYRVLSDEIRAPRE